MGAPRGNKNAVGNKGGGRKSAYEEQRAAQKVISAFINGVDVEELQNLKKQKKVKLIDYTLLRALKSDRVLTELLKKVLPDKLQSEVHDGKLSDEQKKQLDKILNDFDD